MKPDRRENGVAHYLLGDMSRRVIIIICIVAVTATYIWFVTSREHSERPQFGSQTPDSIEVIVGDEQVGTITNTPDLMSLLRDGRWMPPHSCAARGQFIIRYSVGDAVRISFYPGHSDSKYEFAVGGKGYTVARKPLMAILEAAGIDGRKIPQ